MTYQEQSWVQENPKERRSVKIIMIKKIEGGCEGSSMMELRGARGKL